MSYLMRAQLKGDFFLQILNNKTSYKNVEITISTIVLMCYCLNIMKNNESYRMKQIMQQKISGSTFQI